MGAMRLGFKHVVISGVSVGILFVWMSLHFSSKPMLELQSPSFQHTPGNPQDVVERSDCGLDLPFPNRENYASCQLKLPLKDSCKIAKSLFSEEPRRCSRKDAVTYCRLQTKDVTCDISTCKASVEVGYINTVSGLMSWTECSTSTQVVLLITDRMKKTQHSGYVFIRCPRQVPYPTQLLVLPPSLPSAPRVAKDARININILFIDSVSYYHFHRSLPKTLLTLQKLSAGSSKVLSYPLFQSLKSRTYENIQALFSGTVDLDQTFGSQAMPKSAVKVETLLQPLRERGYENLMMEDLCWHWEWGFSKDLLVHNKSLGRTEYWSNMMKAFDKAFITSYGISPSSCEILKTTGFPDPFHGVPTVCYNGLYQHSYFLDYLDNYHSTMTDAGIPFSSFFSCNVAHDELGTRVQTLDKDLVQHITTASKLSNTLTVLLSDHGNNYGQFPQSHQQGRDEAYHPVLYIIVPEGTQELLGSEVMVRMEENQDRLVTMLDLHYLLKYISSPSTQPPAGLLSNIPPDRLCSDLPLFQPNICICADSKKITLPTTELSLLAEFASGILTNKLIDAVGGLTSMKCHALLPVSYRNVQVSAHKNGGMIVSMYINYPSSTRSKDTIFVSLLYRPSISKHGPSSIQLLAFERISTYSIYKGCGDGPTTESLCICSSQSYFYNKASNWMLSVKSSDLLANHRKSFMLNSCIYIAQSYTSAEGCSVYAVNICAESYSLLVKIVDQKLIYFSSFPEEGWTISRLNVRFLFILNSINSETITSVLQFYTSVM